MITDDLEVGSTVYPKLMGVLNVTADSFFDGGRYQKLENAIAHARKMIQEGADIIDVGGESTRPGAVPITIEQECDRVIPVIERLKQEFATPISIDTRRGSVMHAAFNAGASIINDVQALSDPLALKVVSATQATVCLMHMKGTPATMQNAPYYDDILQEIYNFFVERIAICVAHGISKKNIWIDPGFGFGKLLSHNLKLLGNLSFFQSLECPILVGLSRKSMFGEILGLPVQERLQGSIAAAIIAQIQGVTFLRTHDVAATKQALTVINAVKPYFQHPRRREVNGCSA